jgi:hypothetical protein
MPACKEKRFVVKAGRFSVFKSIIIKITASEARWFVWCLNVDNSNSIVEHLWLSVLGVTHFPTPVIIAMKVGIDII